ncbi:MAG TPA: hypothetical protein VFL04_06190, partial [Rectinemataceae bacterium]|nr:hypothetical protein [Rectinemataceae bacterium]
MLGTRAKPGSRRAWVLILGAGATAMLAIAALSSALFLSGPALGREPAPVRPGIPPEPGPEQGPIPALEGPVTIAIQPGHWQVAELPDELWRLRESTGAVWGGTREVDINRGVAVALSGLIQARGWRALVLPATIPPGLRADAFIAIHADWGPSPGIRGWKVAPPWRASAASERLADELGASFAAEPGSLEDRGGITVS